MVAIIQKYVINYLLKYGGQLLMDLWKHFLRSQEQRKALDNLEKVVVDPNSRVEDVGAAYEQMFNAGRK